MCEFNLDEDDVGTCPSCGEDSPSSDMRCNNCRVQDWLDSEESSPYTPFG